jgi:tetratricopeptide (TPR) repeat protein
MDCKEFEEHIYEYFSDPDFDWKLRHEIDEHYFACDKCYETYQVAKLMTDKSLKEETAIILQISEAEKALEENPDNQLAKAKLASLYRSTGMPIEEIPADYVDALVEPLIKTAEKEYAENQNFDRASELYQEAHLWKPEDINIKKMFGILKYHAGSYKDAIEILEDVKQVLNSDPDVFTVLGDAYSESKDYHEALSNYEIAYELGHEPYVLSHVGSHHAKLGDLDKGREIVWKAYSLNRDDILIWNDMGNIHMMSGEFSEAVTLLEKCVTLTEFTQKIKSISTVYSNLAMAYYNIGQVDNARQYINAAIKLNPDNNTIKHNYGIITGKSEGDLLMLI